MFPADFLIFAIRQNVYTLRIYQLLWTRVKAIFKKLCETLSLDWVYTLNLTRHCYSGMNRFLAHEEAGKELQTRNVIDNPAILLPYCQNV